MEARTEETEATEATNEKDEAESEEEEEEDVLAAGPLKLGQQVRLMRTSGFVENVGILGSNNLPIVGK